MIIQRLFSDSSKEDRKKSKIAGGVAIGSVLGGVGADQLSKNQEKKGEKILEDYKQNLKAREKRIAKKTGTENTIKNFFTGKNSEAIKNAEEMAKRHKALVKRAADKHFKAASRLKTADTALTLAGLGAAAYALKKRGDAEQNKMKEK